MKWVFFQAPRSFLLIFFHLPHSFLFCGLEWEVSCCPINSLSLCKKGNSGFIVCQLSTLAHCDDSRVWQGWAFKRSHILRLTFQECPLNQAEREREEREKEECIHRNHLYLTTQVQSKVFLCSHSSPVKAVRSLLRTMEKYSVRWKGKDREERSGLAGCLLRSRGGGVCGSLLLCSVMFWKSLSKSFTSVEFTLLSVKCILGVKEVPTARLLGLT